MIRIATTVLLGLCVLTPSSAAQAVNPEVQRFKQFAARIVDQRVNGLQEDEKQQQQALDLLDAFVGRRASGGAALDVPSLNAALSEFVTQHPSVGESYQIVPFGAGAEVYALVVNFSSSGPAAIRLYLRPQAAPEGQAAASVPRRVARIDRFAVADFFDENVNVVPLGFPVAAGIAPPTQPGEGREALFVTVSGRTDELQTGAFAVWRWNEGGLRRVWESDLLQQSSYEATGDELRLTFCGETDDDRPRECRRMVRERYAWREGGWNRLEQADAPVAKP